MQEGKDRVPEAESVKVRNENGVREFTKATDGDDYTEKADAFAAEVEGREVIK